MDSSRIESLRKMLERSPGDARLRFALAVEYEKAGRWEAVAEELRQYLDTTDDQGNAWGRLGRALRELGRPAEARQAYERGVDAARRHGHPGMAAEFEEILEEWE
ncbi:MAG TPA: tetratricopeptide repeat protein [Longimicrobiales bacterium]|nr:tetratricopeptide repeat protein [Longimicrobiales bacterium]